jgi:hypothetical protein
MCGQNDPGAAEQDDPFRKNNSNPKDPKEHEKEVQNGSNFDVGKNELKVRSILPFVSLPFFLSVLLFHLSLFPLESFPSESKRRADACHVLTVGQGWTSSRLEGAGPLQAGPQGHGRLLRVRGLRGRGGRFCVRSRSVQSSPTAR